MRMFELRFLRDYGEASFRIARLEPVGCGKPKASEGGSPSFGHFSWRRKKSDLLPGNPRPTVVSNVGALTKN
jgi:hypothetical protein